MTTKIHHSPRTMGETAAYWQAVADTLEALVAPAADIQRAQKAAQISAMLVEEYGPELPQEQGAFIQADTLAKIALLMGNDDMLQRTMPRNSDGVGFRRQHLTNREAFVALRCMVAVVRYVLRLIDSGMDHDRAVRELRAHETQMDQSLDDLYDSDEPNEMYPHAAARLDAIRRTLEQAPLPLYTDAELEGLE